MGALTHYLTIREEDSGTFIVRIESGTPLPAIRKALKDSIDLRYSPILPAYLTPNEQPPTPPSAPASIAFFFALRPHHSLGAIKPGLSQHERDMVFFTEGLASILILDCELERALEVKSEIGCSHMEFWLLSEGRLKADEAVVSREPAPKPDGLEFDLALTGNPVVDVYLEQISASITTLWAFYGLFFPEERTTLTRLLEFAKSLIPVYVALSGSSPSITELREQNAILSALVELSASLSYSVTQGTSGAPPLLANRSPFPHHSLLGVSGAVRALTKFTRYLESAFKARDAAEVIREQYRFKKVAVPMNIPDYKSGRPYHFDLPSGEREEFDQGGEFVSSDMLPLLTHFSLRHGFKETKFSVTAASESLTAESLPPWTLMTLSHEIMHSRVRMIFNALFGADWNNVENPGDRWDKAYTDFVASLKSSDQEPLSLEQGIRNVILNFCVATERAAEVVPAPREGSALDIKTDKVREAYLKHKRVAVELFVHFHDYYFAYAKQPKLYVMSLWASWTTVAAPVARPLEYLVRTLATIACGTSLEAVEAFNYAAAEFTQGILALKDAGIRSTLFDELESLLRNQARHDTRSYFKPAYYLIDQVRKNFASAIIASRIDGLRTDPFAEGSSEASDYLSSIYVYGEQTEGQIVSPIRHSLATLLRQLLAGQEIDDLQWLTAWNAIVIASQEVGQC